MARPKTEQPDVKPVALILQVSDPEGKLPPVAYKELENALAGCINGGLCLFTEASRDAGFRPVAFIYLHSKEARDEVVANILNIECRHKAEHTVKLTTHEIFATRGTK